MVSLVLCVANAVIYETRLPNVEVELKFPFGAEGESSFDELQSLFQWYLGCGCQQQMKVIGHDDKFMQKEPAFSQILHKHIDQELSHAIRLEKRAASRRC